MEKRLIEEWREALSEGVPFHFMMLRRRFTLLHHSLSSVGEGVSLQYMKREDSSCEFHITNQTHKWRDTGSS